MDIDRAKALLNAGSLVEARELLLDAVDRDSGNRRAWRLLAGIATRGADWALGARAFRALVTLKPGDALASSGLVKCLMELDQSQEALDEIDRFTAVPGKTESIETQCVLSEHATTRRTILERGDQGG